MAKTRFKTTKIVIWWYSKIFWYILVVRKQISAYLVIYVTRVNPSSLFILKSVADTRPQFQNVLLSTTWRRQFFKVTFSLLFRKREDHSNKRKKYKRLREPQKGAHSILLTYSVRLKNLCFFLFLFFLPSFRHWVQRLYSWLYIKLCHSILLICVKSDKI